jgi:hypothetical protein
MHLLARLNVELNHLLLISIVSTQSVMPRRDFRTDGLAGFEIRPFLTVERQL